jgi:glycosyltransferase involved in cell wall biosynthesis
MVIPINQQTLSSLADLPEVELGLLVPRRWVDRQFGTAWEFALTDARITAFPSPVRLSGRVGGYHYRRRDIRRAIQTFQPDLLQVGQECFSLSAWQMTRAAMQYDLPLCLYAWESMDRPLSWPRRHIRKVVLERTRVLQTAGADAAALHRRWGYRGRIDLFPQLGIDPEQFAPAPSRERGEGLRIGFVGRLIPRKGVDLLLRAAARLCDRGVPCTVHICGSGPEEAALRTLATQLGLEAAVEWLGFQPHDRIPEILAGLDVLAVPSRSEADWAEQFGHVLIEAMSMEVPPIGSSCGEIPTVIGNPELIFEEEDLDQFEALLHRASEAPEWRRSAGRRGRERVLAEYAHGQISRKYLAGWEYALG